MKKIKLSCMAMVLAAAQTVMAGGLLTNTNQNVSFLRNPARDAAIGIDGVYSNPAGVAFLGEGFHPRSTYRMLIRLVRYRHGQISTS